MSNKFLTLAVGLAFSPALFAQSVEEGKKELYYQELKAAEQTFSKVIAGNPANGEAYYYLSQVFFSQEEGMLRVDSLLKTVPAEAANDPHVQVTRGQLLLEQGKVTEADQFFTNAIAAVKKKEQPTFQILSAKAHVDAKAGDPNKALQWLTEAEGRDKKNPDLYIVRGDAYRKMANGGDAIKNYSIALDYNSKLAEAYHKIGKIYVSQDNREAYVPNFEKAVEADPAYRPSIYELYYYYYFRDVNRAKEYLDKYIAASKPSSEYDYMKTDLMFVSGKYDEAINSAQAIMQRDGENAEPRLLKLIAYSYDGKQDSLQARSWMEKYFQSQPEDKQIAKDFDFMGRVLMKFPGEEVAAAQNLEKAVAMDTSAVEKLKYINSLTGLYKKLEDKSKEAYWLGMAYQTKPNPSNTDLYNWGSAHYFAKEYQKADSVFALYTEKYPDQVFGPYWQARSNMAIDTAMEMGLAVPHYKKLIEIAGKDTATNKTILVQANGYLAAYHANIAKDYAQAVAYLDNILALQPDNREAQANKEILEKVLANNPPADKKDTTEEEKEGGQDQKEKTMTGSGQAEKKTNNSQAGNGSK